jgi:hypothetical protein
VSWNRLAVARALVPMFTTATAGGPAAVYVHERPPEILNPYAVVISRPVQVIYATGAFGVDEAELPVAIVGGVEADDTIDTVKAQCRGAVDADPTLAGAVKAAWASSERNWRNVTGAGGIQLLLVELILTIQM